MAKSPKSTPEAQAAFRAIVPKDGRVTVRPMFGSIAAFANGYMFMGLFGPTLFVRLGEQDRQSFLGDDARPFEPTAGRPMRDYFAAPGEWQARPEEVGQIAEAALRHTLGLPPKG